MVGEADVVLPEMVADPEIIEASGIRWIHIESPRTADRDWLEEHFDFHPLDYEDVFSRNQRPKLDQYDDYVFIVLHFPLFDKDTNRILTAELDLFMGPDYLVTMPNMPLPPLSAMFERYREKDDLREEVFSKGTGYLLYKIVDTGVDASFPMLRKTALKLERLEDDIFEGRSSEIVRELSDTKQEIINFRKIVRPQRAVLRDLERTKQRYLQEELEIYFDDISDAAERIWDTLENYKEVIEGLESTNEAVLSHQLNDSFRILTAASVVLLPLTLIASVFGMNVQFPGEGESITFYLILSRMAVLLVALVILFRRRGWL
jgi:magnesium transporter